MHLTPPQQKLPQNVNSAKVEKPCIRPWFSKTHLSISTLSPTPSWEPGTKGGCLSAFTESR